MYLRIFRKYQIQPSKRLGQNFLVERRVIKEIIEAAEIQPEDVVLEIGPGLGALTQELAKKAERVVAIEKDLRMCEILKELLEDWNVKNVKIIQEDIRRFENWKLEIGNSYKVVANLPFYLTAPVIRKFLEAENRPEEMILVVQKEVAQRICVKPPDMNLLAVSVQFYSKPEIVSYVSKKSFWPSPKVDSAILRITPLINADRKLINADLFFRVAKAGFSQPRKQIINNLSRLRAYSAEVATSATKAGQDFGGQAKKINREKINNWLLKNNIRPIQRAETLTIEDWISLAKSCKIE